MMRIRYVLVFALAFALVLGMSIAPASAYFTDQHTANGGLPIEVGPDTGIHEWTKDKTKRVRITNNEDSGVAVFVRVQSDHAKDVLKEDVSVGDGWVLDGDWYVYQHALAIGASTSDITFTYDFGKVGTIDKQPPVIEGDNYNVVINYEAVPVNIEPLPSWAQGLDPKVQGGN